MPKGKGQIKIQPQVVEQQLLLQQRAVEQQRMEREAQRSPVDESEIQEIVDIDQIWQALKESSKVWPLIIDWEVKELIVEHYKNYYRNKGVALNKPSSHYVQLMDLMTQEDAGMLEHPFADILRLLAIMEYDFNNGEDKDALARKVLGEKSFAENKRRLGLAK